jgi:hypothetical protein
MGRYARPVLASLVAQAARKQRAEVRTSGMQSEEGRKQREGIIKQENGQEGIGRLCVAIKAAGSQQRTVMCRRWGSRGIHLRGKERNGMRNIQLAPHV